MSSAQEIIGIMREGQTGREDRVLKDTRTIGSGRRIVKLACKHLRDRGEGQG
jgi:hypothetical protein